MYEEQEVAFEESLRSRALGAKWIPDDQSRWIATIHTHWPMPGYLNCDKKSLVYLFSVSIGMFEGVLQIE